MCCSPWGHKESDMTEWLNNNNNKVSVWIKVWVCFPNPLTDCKAHKGQTTVEVNFNVRLRQWWDQQSSTVFCFFFFFNIWLYPAACGTLVAWPGVKPASPALEGRVLNTGLLGKSQHHWISPKSQRDAWECACDVWGGIEVPSWEFERILLVHSVCNKPP